MLSPAYLEMGCVTEIVWQMCKFFENQISTFLPYRYGFQALLMIEFQTVKLQKDI